MPITTPKVTLPALFCLLAAGCADVEWQKAGTDRAATGRDLSECTQEARLQAGRETIPRLVAAPVITIDPQGRPTPVHPAPQDADRMLIEQRHTRDCMQKQGYELAPVRERY
jgi:hypothetical protein